MWLLYEEKNGARVSFCRITGLENQNFTYLLSQKNYTETDKLKIPKPHTLISFIQLTQEAKIQTLQIRCERIHYKQVDTVKGKYQWCTVVYEV